MELAQLLPQETTEIGSHYKMRLTVFERAIKDGVTEERAALLATIFKNCYFIGAGYNDDVVKESQKYWEQAWIDHYNEVKAD